DGSTQTNTVSQAGISTTGSGSVIVQTTNGSITVNSGVTSTPTALVVPINTTGVATQNGNILLSAQGTGSNVVVNGTVTSDTGNVTLMSATDIQQNAGSAVSSGSGTIDIEATNGSISMSDTGLTTSTSGDVRLAAANDITLGGVDAGTGNVSLKADTVTDGGDTYEDITGASLLIQANSDIGQIDPAAIQTLEINVGALAAASQGGNIALQVFNNVNIQSVTVTVDRVQGNGSLQPISDSGSNVSTTGTGQIVILTGGTLTVSSAVTTDSGAIGITTTGDLTMSGGSTITSGTGAINLSSDGNMGVTSVSSTGGSAINITSGGMVYNNSTTQTANFTTTGPLQFLTVNGVGTAAQTVYVDVPTILVTNTGTGVINITSLGNLTILGVTQNGNGTVTLSSTAGDLTIAGAILTGSSSVSLSTGGTVTINSPITTTSGAVLVNGGVVDQNASITTTTGDVTVMTSSGAITMDKAIVIRSVNGSITMIAWQDLLVSRLITTYGNITAISRYGSILSVLTDGGTNFTAGGTLKLSAKQDVGTTDNPIRIDARVISLIDFNGSNLALEIANGPTFNGSPENLYFILTKRDHEPYLTTAVVPDQPTELSDAVEIVEPDDLLQKLMDEVFFGDYYLWQPEAGNILAMASKALQLTMHPLFGVMTVSDRFNREVEAELEATEGKVAELATSQP
ncbi:MAG TPA: hypothetical protein VJ998_05970, partial [Pseudomonadales bacterium]|nr:hypothetical protein [Pseudomonadales bacterium]